MTIFEIFKSKNIDELVDWFDEYIICDGSPWLKWWDDNYCHNCESEICCVEGYLKDEMEFGWCELNDKCKFFQDMDDVPDNKQIIKMWLESEYDDTSNGSEEYIICDRNICNQQDYDSGCRTCPYNPASENYNNYSLTTYD